MVEPEPGLDISIEEPVEQILVDLGYGGTIHFSFALHNIEFSRRPESEPGHLVIRTKLGLFALPFG